MAKKARTRARQAQRQREQQKKRNWLVISAVVAIAAIAFVVWGFQQGQTGDDIGEHVAYQGQDHLNEGETFSNYNSDPPTSGPHGNAPTTAGFHDTPVPDGMIIHNLEHGYIAISYDCDKLTDCDSVKNNLQTLMDKFNNFKVVAVPRTNRDAAIAVTAWQRIDLMDEYDEARISAFINAWRNKAPEKTPN